MSIREETAACKEAMATLRHASAQLGSANERKDDWKIRYWEDEIAKAEAIILREGGPLL